MIGLPHGTLKLNGSQRQLFRALYCSPVCPSMRYCSAVATESVKCVSPKHLTGFSSKMNCTKLPISVLGTLYGSIFVVAFPIPKTSVKTIFISKSSPSCCKPPHQLYSLSLPSVPLEKKHVDWLPHPLFICITHIHQGTECTKLVWDFQNTSMSTFCSS